MRSIFSRPGGLAAALLLISALPAWADETPKRGGTLVYMIPADAPPSFDAQREETYATIYAFKIRQGVKFADGTTLTADDVAASWNKIIFPPPGIISPRQSNFLMVDKIEAPDPSTVVFHLKFATDAFIP